MQTPPEMPDAFEVPPMPADFEPLFVSRGGRLHCLAWSDTAGWFGCDIDLADDKPDMQDLMRLQVWNAIQQAKAAQTWLDGFRASVASTRTAA